MGLRTSSGVEHPLLLPWLHAIEDNSSNQYRRVKRLQDLKLIEIDSTSIRATPAGLAVLNAILPDITNSLVKE